MKNTLQIGQAYIVNGQPMVLHTIENGRYNFTDGRYGFGRSFGYHPSDDEILNNLEVAEDVNPQDILDDLESSVSDMANSMNRKR
tara:strand:- start:29 stop:283 length:255 start_codon:yes stop_codon:yes gene_type:complete